MYFENIKDFIEKQYSFRSLIQGLFQYRFQGGLTYAQALERCGGETNEIKLSNFLNLARMGIETESGIMLDPELKYLYERILDVSERISVDDVSRIRPDIEEICKEWESCTDVKDKKRLVSDLYLVLDSIPSSLQRSLSDIRRITEDEYKSALSLNLKKAKLEALLGRAGKIHAFLDESYSLLSDQEHLLRTVILVDGEVDSSMLSIILRRAVSEVLISSRVLTELTFHIQDYISRVERATRLCRKIRFVSKKISSGTLVSETNFENVLEQYEEIGIKGETYCTRGRFNVGDIIEDGRFIEELCRLRDEEYSSFAVSSDQVEPFDFDAMEKEKDGKYLFVPSYQVLFRSFKAQGRDLMSFLMDYDFHGEILPRQRYQMYLFFVTSAEHYRRMRVTDDFSEMQYSSTDDGYVRKVVYRVVYP